ncbi:MAG: 5-formyltetrahydrofolate cyclo-ligase [Chitinivibrionales bacterium]|nr:5-formyltetrahydrofolate cyclo-ligase [Chitinivibrionales bacterium]
MNGIVPSEIIIILLLFVLFFGSKELPQFLRQAAKVMGKVRHYTQKVKLELNEAMRAIDPPAPQKNPNAEKKKAWRAQFLAARKELTAGQKEEKADKIFELIFATPEYLKASSVMIYIDQGSEVPTRKACKQILAQGKRLIVPYCRTSFLNLGLAAISDLESDLAPGEIGLWEPVAALRDKFFKSDLQFIICPGVAFDRNGKRLGRGKGYYDNFLRELKGLKPVWGIAFDCQISNELFPFDYQDVDMDQVVTESGLVIKKNNG